MAHQGMTSIRMQLQKECSNALRHYIQTLSEGCDLLGEIKEGMITKEKREKIFSHRHEELLARAAYDRTQRQLWRFLSETDKPAPVTRLDESPEPKRNLEERRNQQRAANARRMG
jgi:hypothetical protein